MWTSLGLAEVNVLRGADPTDGVHGRGRVDPRPRSAASRGRADGRRCSTPVGHRRPRGARGRRRLLATRDPGTTSGWVVKIVLLGLVDALAITGLLIALDAGGVGLRRRARRDARRPQRRLPAAALRPDEVPAAGAVLPRRVRRVPGALHGVHVDDELRHRLRADARTRRSTRSRASRSAGPRARRRTTSRRCAAPTARSPATASTTRRPSEIFLGTTDGLEPLDEPAELQVLTTTGRTFIVSVGDLEGVRPGDVDTLPGYPADPESYVMPGRDRGLDDPHLRRPGVREPVDRSVYDPETGDDHRHRDRHRLHRRSRASSRPPDGTTLTPGFTASVGLRQLPRGASPATSSAAPSCGCWRGRSPSPLLSVVDSFALGLLLAMVFNDERMRGRKFYRSLIIIPYALPGVHDGARLARHAQPTFGINRWLGIDVGWLETHGAGDVLADPRQPVARLPVHVPRLHRRPAEHPDRPQGGRLRRRGDRARRRSARSRSRCC